MGTLLVDTPARLAKFTILAEIQVHDEILVCLPACDPLHDVEKLLNV
ncbi:hypothetical protein ES702_00186 [subsurface metagenome]